MVDRLRTARQETFRSLQHRNFRLYFAGQAVSFTGTWLQLVAQALLVLRLTGSGTALGLLTAIQFTPTLVLGAWAGLIVDRHDKRRLMTVTTSVMLAAALTLGLLELTGQVTTTWVYALAAVLGLANTFDNPARRSLVNELVPPEALPNAVNLNSTLITTARLLGPAFAGLLVATVGIGWCFVVNAATFVGPLVTIWLMDAAAIRAAPRAGRRRGQLREGFRHVWAVDDLRIPLLVVALVGTLAFNFQVTYPLLAERELGGGDTGYTLLSMVAGAGSLVGALRLTRRKTIDIVFVARSSLALGFASLGLAASPTLAIALLFSAWAGYAGIGVLSGSNTLVQVTASPQMRGRVLALFTVVFLGSTPIGGPIVGWIAEHAGTRWAFVLGGAASLVAGAAALWRPARREVAIPTFPSAAPVQ